MIAFKDRYFAQGSLIWTADTDEIWKKGMNLDTPDGIAVIQDIELLSPWSKTPVKHVAFKVLLL